MKFIKFIKFIKYIWLLIVVSAVVSANADTSDKKSILYIIDGYFFHEIPMDKGLINGMMSIQTANGTRAMGLILKQPLPEEAVRLAVPETDIEEAEILLDMYKEKRNGMLSISGASERIFHPGEKFPEFEAEDISGHLWSNKDVEGKIMVLNCWFTGCGPCRAEMPELSEWKNEMPDVMFFSSTYEKPSIAAPVLEKTGFNWIHLVNDTQFKEYVGPKGYPLTIVIGKDGIIALAENGTSPLQREKIRNTIDSLRKIKTGPYE